MVQIGGGNTKLRKNEFAIHMDKNSYHSSTHNHFFLFSNTPLFKTQNHSQMNGLLSSLLDVGKWRLEMATEGQAVAQLDLEFARGDLREHVGCAGVCLGSGLAETGDGGGAFQHEDPAGSLPPSLSLLLSFLLSLGRNT